MTKTIHLVGRDIKRVTVEKLSYEGAELHEIGDAILYFHDGNVAARCSTDGGIRFEPHSRTQGEPPGLSSTEVTVLEGPLRIRSVNRAEESATIQLANTTLVFDNVGDELRVVVFHEESGKPRTYGASTTTDI